MIILIEKDGHDELKNSIECNRFLARSTPFSFDKIILLLSYFSPLSKENQQYFDLRL